MLAQFRCQFARKKVHEPVLLRADLGQDHVIEAGLDIAFDRFYVDRSRRSAADLPGYGLRHYMLAGGRKTFGIG